MKKTTPDRLQERLRKCQADYQAIKARIADVGFICTGSLVKRWLACGKPNCRCMADPAHKHGPYYQLSWKEAGVTVSQRLPAEHAHLYEEWIRNRRQLEALVQQMQRVSAKAGQHLLRAATDLTATPKPKRQRRKPRTQR